MPRRNSSAPTRKPRRRFAGQMTDRMLPKAGACWCGLPSDHNWPGRQLGEPHPVAISHWG